jgi:hypothetical protein
LGDASQHGADRFGCPEFQRNLALDRRGFVKAGALGLVDLSLSGHIQCFRFAVPMKKSFDQPILLSI